VNSSSFVMQVNTETEQFQKLVKTFPGLRVGFMSQIARSGRLTLKGMLVGGNGLIDLQQYPKSAKGKRTIKASVLIRSGRIKFSSFPVNLFENGRKLRDGTKEAPKKIITGKFKNVAMSQLQGWANSAERTIFDKAFSES